jgi:radical SAM superfamily enzyme YgiQ (UPF0313 family)
MTARASCNVLLVFPRFETASFWSLEAACQVAGRRSPGPPLGLITVAALLPPEWAVRLVDRNAEELHDNDLNWADLVMTGGMIPQRPDSLRVIELCHTRGKPVAVGGPDVSSSPDIYIGADFRVIGEAESLMESFARAWSEGARSGVFKGEPEKTDVTASPIPRFDLLNLEYYLHVNIQFSRGCPFTCEFCDIIELYGRVPRTKTVEQMLAELDALHRAGYRGTVSFVDDNFIGNKKAVKSFLPYLVAWQKKRNYPFDFFTEASVNLADDDVLLQMMREANFGAVFIGIESPNVDLLIAMQKKQNTRRDLVKSIKKIYSAGMFVMAGFIVGFDNENDRVKEEIIACIEATAIPICMVGLLTALPNTQLYRRLLKEGRLPSDANNFDGSRGSDQCTMGLNFETLRPRDEIIKDYVEILKKVYEPQAYFARVREMLKLLRCAKVGRRVSLKRNDLSTVGRLGWWLIFRHPQYLNQFLITAFSCILRNPSAIHQMMTEVVMYFHVGPFAEHVVDQMDQQLAMLDGESRKGHLRLEPFAAA